MSHYLQSLKEWLSSPGEIPSCLVDQYNQLLLRRRSHEAVIQMLSNFTQFTESEIKEKYRELKDSEEFIRNFSNERNIIGVYSIPEQALTAHLIVRLLQPSNVVETGVATGNSSACILKALDLNGTGTLHSIDLPGTEESPVVDSSTPYKEAEIYEFEDKSRIGWRVPEGLKKQWDFRLGSSKDLLEPLLKELGTMEVFLHDSKHSYQNMTWEYGTVLPHLSPEGIVISDDVDWNSAFQDFTHEKGLLHDTLKNYLSPRELNGGKFPEKTSCESLSVVGVFRQK